MTETKGIDSAYKYVVDLLNSRLPEFDGSSLADIRESVEQRVQWGLDMIAQHDKEIDR